LNKIASTKNQSHRFNAATYVCLLTCSGAFDWCRWTFNVEEKENVGKPPPELRDFAHIPPTVQKALHLGDTQAVAAPQLPQLSAGFDPVLARGLS